MQECLLCRNDGGELLFKCGLYRIIGVNDEVDYPGYLRIIANAHVRELTDLSNADNLRLYQTVIKCEQILREIYNPDKINIASLGNLIPHVHWHIIPRFSIDKHFPNPIWGAATHSSYVPADKLNDLHLSLKERFKAFAA